MFHPIIKTALRYLLIASGTLFTILMGVTVLGVILIEINGGVV